MEVADFVVVLLHDNTPEQALEKARSIHRVLASMQRLRICVQCGIDYDPQTMFRANVKYCSMRCCNKARDARQYERTKLRRKLKRVQLVAADSEVRNAS